MSEIKTCALIFKPDRSDNSPVEAAGAIGGGDRSVGVDKSVWQLRPPTFVRFGDYYFLKRVC